MCSIRECVSTKHEHTCVAVSLPMFILRVPGTVLRAMFCFRFISEKGRKAAKMIIPGRALRSRCMSSQLRCPRQAGRRRRRSSHCSYRLDVLRALQPIFSAGVPSTYVSNYRNKTENQTVKSQTRLFAILQVMQSMSQDDNIGLVHRTLGFISGCVVEPAPF